MTTSHLPDLSSERFSAIEAKILGSEEGRAFMRQYLASVRADGDSRLMGAISDLRMELGERLSSEDARERVAVLRVEIQEMAVAIAKTRKEIADLRPKGAGSERINAATEELDAVVSATETATSDILAAAERLLEVAAGLKAKGHDAEAQAVEAEATEIFMACSFQDITGQRTSKVVSTLRFLENRVSAMIEIWGSHYAPLPAAVPSAPDEHGRPDGHLLNGPAMPGQGRSQDEIDAMLFGGDSPAPANTAINQSAIDDMFA